ncbi:MAG: dienelactone hydrolase family protein [Acidimicrobiales bacterium]
MAAYQAEPEAGQPPGQARGGVVVVQEAFGVTAHIESVCRRLAAAGWTAVAPALFHRQGAPVLRYDDYASVSPLMAGLEADGIRADIGAALDHLESCGFGPGRSAIVGFCMGGTIAFHTAVDRPLGAAASFYGGGLAEGRFGFPPQLERAKSLRTPMLGLYGDRDRSIPPDQVEALRQALAGARVPAQLVRYPDAEHGFNCDHRPEVYNPQAAGDAWGRTLDWFAAHVEEV